MIGSYNPACWLAAHGVMENGDPMPPCDGRLIRAHLIDKQVLKRFADSGRLIEDQRSFVLACGGPTGCSGHHGHFDYSRRLRVPFSALPKGTIELAAEIGLDWWLERTYA